MILIYIVVAILIYIAGCTLWFLDERKVTSDHMVVASMIAISWPVWVAAGVVAVVMAAPFHGMAWLLNKGKEYYDERQKPSS